MMLTVVADSAIPGLAALEKHVNLIRIAGDKIDARDLQGASGLLIRSITKIDAELLRYADELRFVGSATIGQDHVQLQALKDKKIAFAHAPGCNANAVVDYVLASASHLSNGTDLSALSLGIIGYGNVGSRLHKAFTSLGGRCLVLDPFKPAPNATDYLEELLECDVVSIHVPLTMTGEYATAGLITEKALSRPRSTGRLKKQILINTSRGAVLELGLLTRKHTGWQFVNDVWLNEPNVCGSALTTSSIATPHIAGHSIAGKLRGTQALLEVLPNYLPELEHAELTADNLINADMLESSDPVDDPISFLQQLERRVAIETTSQHFKLIMSMCRSDKARGSAFKALRRKAQRPLEFNYTGLNT